MNDIYAGPRIFASANMGYHPRIDFYLGTYGDRGGRNLFWAKELEFSVEPTPGVPPKPTLSVEAHAAQELIDQLWDCGLRPTQGKQSEGLISATERHLSDMRAIAFSSLKAKLP